MSSDRNSGGINKIIEGKNYYLKILISLKIIGCLAYKVFGEGIFFTLDAEKLQEWEKKRSVKKYFTRMLNNARKLGLILVIHLTHQNKYFCILCHT